MEKPCYLRSVRINYAERIGIGTDQFLRDVSVIVRKTEEWKSCVVLGKFEPDDSSVTCHCSIDERKNGEGVLL